MKDLAPLFACSNGNENNVANKIQQAKCDGSAHLIFHNLVPPKTPKLKIVLKNELRN